MNKFSRTALITGITGQDGSYLAEFLLERGYTVFGMHRRTSVPNFQNIEHIKNKIHLVYGEMTDVHSLNDVVKEVHPDEVYNLAAQSDVKISESQPSFTWETNAFGVARLINAITKFAPSAKLYQAGTSEMFGSSPPPQNENTAFVPQSPYGEAKLWAWEQMKIARVNGLFAVTGLLFNHESPRRGLNFVTRKITHALSSVKLGLLDRFELGNLEAKRDWGFAGDYVRAMHSMLQQENPCDYVISTGESHTVKEFVQAAADALKMKISFDGEGVEEKVFWDARQIISVDNKLFRNQEVNYLCGDSSKARSELGWHPTTTFKQLVEIMVTADMKQLTRQNV